MFARHLVLQGYKTDQVTILTTYSGQLFLMRSVSLYNFSFKFYDNQFFHVYYTIKMIINFILTINIVYIIF